jgi:hypothetical protein
MTEPKETGLLYAGERTRVPEPPGYDEFRGELDVNVIFTTWPGTEAALCTASHWCCCLGARILLWSPHIVPRRFSLTVPPVSTAFMQQRLQSLVVACCKDLEVMIQVSLCGDSEQCLLNVLELDSIVLVGGKKCWLPTQEQKLASLLQSCGHRVLFIPSVGNVPAMAKAPEQVPT